MKDYVKGVIIGLLIGLIIGYSLNVSNSDFNELKENYEVLSQKYDELMVAYQKTLGMIPLTPERPSTEVIEKVYSWNYHENQWTISLSIPESIYEFYRTQERAPTNEYSIYVTHPFDDDYIKSIIEKMNKFSIQQDLTESEKVNLVISFVQSLPYTYDNITTPHDDYPRYPLETLVEGGGDCEDTSILTAAILREMGYKVILIDFPTHVACGVNIENVYGSYYLVNDEKFFFLETTGEGWELGNIPDDYQGVSAHCSELVPIPIITHQWNASWDNEQLIISVRVKNVGSAMAENYKVWVGFDAGDNKVWNQVESEPFNLNFGRENVIDLTLELPTDKHTRLIVYVVNNEGYYVSDSYSKWFDT